MLRGWRFLDPKPNEGLMNMMNLILADKLTTPWLQNMRVIKQISFVLLLATTIVNYPTAAAPVMKDTHQTAIEGATFKLNMKDRNRGTLIAKCSDCKQQFIRLKVSRNSHARINGNEVSFAQIHVFEDTLSTIIYNYDSNEVIKVNIITHTAGVSN